MRRTSRYSFGSGIFPFLPFPCSFINHYYIFASITFSSFDFLKLQRGTGLSTPLTTSSMLQFKSPQELVDYLKYFRADNIVNDAEFIRKHLVPDAAPWKLLGQV